MSALSLPGIFPGLGFLHRPRQPIEAADNAASRYRLLQPLSNFIRKPTNALESLVEEFRARSEDASLDKATEERKSLLRLSLRSASTLSEWQAAASELDALEGNNVWKDEDWSTEYNCELVNTRLQELEEARISCDPRRILFLIRTSLSRHLGGLGSLHLYKHSHIGTKRLIEKYIAVALESLSSLLELTRTPHGADLDCRFVLEQVVQARQSFGRSALLLSGGGTFGMNHIGVVKCLWETQLLPRIISGASAGSIVSAVLGTRTDDELPGLIEEFSYGDLHVFTNKDGADTHLTQITRFLKTGALFDISNLKRVMKNLLGDMTFQEAYNRTRRILNICVSSAGVFELPRLLNYITAPNVIIWSAVAASCSVPVIFSPADILAKDPKTGEPVHWNPSSQRWIDGSVDNDLPMTRLAEMFNVNHFIVSQVNPHIVPFLAEEENNGIPDFSGDQVTTGPGWINRFTNLAKDEMMHRMQVLSEIGVFPNLLTKTLSVLNQRYSGDITILPEISYSQLYRLLQNPDSDFMLQATVRGEKATWPKLSRIQNHCAIELALDDAVQALRARVAFSPSQVDLRLNVISQPRSRAGSESGRSRLIRPNRKKLRFSEDMDVNNPSFIQPNEGRQVSPSDPSDPLASSSSNPLRVQERRLPDSPKLKLDPTDTVPMFSTGSEDDSSEHLSVGINSGSSTEGEEGEGYFSRTRRGFASKGLLFPYSSQPATPHISNKKLYLGTSSGSTTSLAPVSNLSVARPRSQIWQYKDINPSTRSLSQDRF